MQTAPEEGKKKTEIILFDTDLIDFTDEDFVCGEADITEPLEDGAKIMRTRMNRMRTIVRIVRTSAPCAENVCMRTSAKSKSYQALNLVIHLAMDSNSLVRGKPLIPHSRNTARVSHYAVESREEL